MHDTQLYRRPTDLHIHSWFSDGTQSPEEIVTIAADSGLSAVAISDHDAVEGLDEAAEAASAAGIDLVPGVELCAREDSVEIHLLGYFVDPSDEALLATLKRLCNGRVERLHKMADRLKELGVTVNPDEVLELAGRGSVGRLHLADYLSRKGITYSTGQAFRRYLGEGEPAYVPSPQLAVPEAISLLHGAGGVAVLAHPGVTGHDKLIPDLAKHGLDGIEAFHPRHDDALSNFYSSIAAERGLLVTGGSDSHGRKNVESIGSVTVPHSCVEKLEEKAREYR